MGKYKQATKETSYAEMYFEDGIFYCNFKKQEVVDLELAKVGVNDRLEMFNGVEYPCLFDISLVDKFTKEARDYTANEGNKLVIASALIVHSPVVKVMANFFIHVNRPKNPTTVFTNKESAVKWLQKYKSSYSLL